MSKSCVPCGTKRYRDVDVETESTEVGELNCRLVSSVGGAPVCCAGGRGFKP